VAEQRGAGGNELRPYGPTARTWVEERRGAAGRDDFGGAAARGGAGGASLAEERRGAAGRDDQGGAAARPRMASSLRPPPAQRPGQGRQNTAWHGELPSTLRGGRGRGDAEPVRGGLAGAVRRGWHGELPPPARSLGQGRRGVAEQLGADLGRRHRRATGWNGTQPRPRHRSLPGAAAEHVHDALVLGGAQHRQGLRGDRTGARHSRPRRGRLSARVDGRRAELSLGVVRGGAGGSVQRQPA
jgi:hypothetical protein